MGEYAPGFVVRMLDRRNGKRSSHYPRPTPSLSRPRPIKIPFNKSLELSVTRIFEQRNILYRLRKGLVQNWQGLLLEQTLVMKFLHWIEHTMFLGGLKIFSGLTQSLWIAHSICS